ncbi:MAG: hypothetical protein SVY41_01085 [Candidatus Nanohaloarchaea archaeon]|nr:hypothetical protein [Candidatus Nanohaloarchaea archaeon]
MKSPDTYLLTYGNLVTPERIEQFIAEGSGREHVAYDDESSSLTVHGERVRPVTVHGYGRDVSHVITDELVAESDRFDHDSALDMIREDYPDAENRGGLTIYRDPGSRINAVLFPVTASDRRLYERMEVGYQLEEVPASQIEPWPGEPGSGALAAVSRNRGSPAPIRDYLRECAASWDVWGEAERFLHTTYIGSENLYEWAKENYGALLEQSVE